MKGANINEIVRERAIEETHPPEAYEMIERWGKMMGSFPSYIRDEQRRASADGAPLDAIYFGADKKWHTTSDITSSTTRAALGLDP